MVDRIYIIDTGLEVNTSFPMLPLKLIDFYRAVFFLLCQIVFEVQILAKIGIIQHLMCLG